MSEHQSWPGEEPEPANGEVEEAEVAEPEDEDTGDGESELLLAGHDAGELDIPDDVNVLEGESRSTRRGVGIVVARASVDVANRLLESALAELDRAGVEPRPDPRDGGADGVRAADRRDGAREDAALRLHRRRRERERLAPSWRPRRPPGCSSPGWRPAFPSRSG